MPQQWRENLRGRVDGLVARSMERLWSEVENLRARLEEVAKIASQRLSFSAIRAALQAGGPAPLNVQGLLGRLAQPQTGGAPALDGFPASADPITQDGALFVLTGATNQLYRVNGAQEPETFELIGGGGSVTSVDATVPVEFSVAGVPITTSGTIAIAKVNQNPNLVWAGPISGAPAQPTFRALVADDVSGLITPADIEGAGYWSPLTNGDPVSPELIFADGDTISIWTPTP